MDAHTRLIEMNAVERLAARDASLFADPVTAATRLGWVGMAAVAAEQAAGFRRLATDAVERGITDVVLLGMGGSSLAALVLSRSIRGAAGYPVLHVLDTTSPSQTRALLESLAPSSTLVIVASKSGSTIEPLSLLAIFRAWLIDALGDAAGAHLIAITDPGSPLEALARAMGFTDTVSSPADVGGRYSALTPFGTLPAALCGIDAARLAATAEVLETACGAPGDENPAVALAAWMADAYEDGRDKLTIVCSPAIGSFGLWVEQLVAESTGKAGRGMLPVLENAPGLPDSHGRDRLTFVLRTEDDRELAALPGLLPEGEPVFEVVIDDPYNVAAAFVHWQWAIALFSALEDIEPFDQPDVEATKIAARSILTGDSAQTACALVPGGFVLMSSPGLPTTDIPVAVASLLDRMVAGSYLAVLAYLPEDDALLAPLRAACAEVATAHRAPVTLELGPRYQHSTGQYHKGGPETGVFLVITVKDPVDLPIPGEAFTLARLHAAQAAGDAAALIALGRPVLALELASDSDLAAVCRALTRAAAAG